MIKVGDWVAQYNAGYWKVINIIPKYADEDYSYNGRSRRHNKMAGYIASGIFAIHVV